MAVSELENIEKRLEEDRAADNVLGVEMFGYIHLPCGKDVVEERDTRNSEKVDPATSDPLPIHLVRLHCNKHNVSSLYDEV